MTVASNIHGLVLAGGKSRRMGSDKALLMQDGQSQLSRAVALLERHLPKVFVSARQDQAGEVERSKFEQIIDRYDDMGPIAGILTAMDNDPTVSWLVLACDLPNVDDMDGVSRAPNVTIVSDDGTKISSFGGIFGEPIGIASLPPYLPQAVIAVEDRRFYDHFGVDGSEPY